MSEEMKNEEMQSWAVVLNDEELDDVAGGANPNAGRQKFVLVQSAPYYNSYMLIKKQLGSLASGTQLGQCTGCRTLTGQTWVHFQTCYSKAQRRWIAVDGWVEGRYCRETF